MPNPRCELCARSTPWYCLLGNSSLSMLQIMIGFIGGSSALIADGIHTFTDVIGTMSVILSRGVAGKPPDSDHHYGHGKVEFMSSAFIYVVLLFLSVAISTGALIMILGRHYRRPEAITLLASCMSVLINSFMFKLGMCAGTRANSPALLANAFENRADAMSACAVIAGIAASIFINPICDPIAALSVGLYILIHAIIQLKDTLGGLMDKALPPEVIRRIKEIAKTQKGVEGVDYVKTRQTGVKYWVDVGIQVNGHLNVCESEAIAAAVRVELMRRSMKFDSVGVFMSARVQPA